MLVPALLLIGAGMGVVITPLTSTVLAGVPAQHAGAASGALSTMQQVGNAIGVAITGIIFFGAAGRGIPHAFELSLIQLAAVCTVAAALTRLLPARRLMIVRTRRRRATPARASPRGRGSRVDLVDVQQRRARVTRAGARAASASVWMFRRGRGRRRGGLVEDLVQRAVERLVGHAPQQRRRSRGVDDRAAVGEAPRSAP